MSVPYFTTCLLCRVSYDTKVATCTQCDSDEYLIDEQFEEKNRDR